MDYSSLGGILKTYPSKNQRKSRSYRPSSSLFHRTNVFEDEESDDPFDKLVNDERKKNSVFTANESSIFSDSNHDATKDDIFILKNLQNVDTDFANVKTVRRKKTSKYETSGKENRYQHHSRLYLDSDEVEEDPYVFNFFSSGKTKVAKSSSKASRSCKPSHKLKTDKLKQLQTYREKHREMQQISIAEVFKVCSTPIKNSISDYSVCDVSVINKQLQTYWEKHNEKQQVSVAKVSKACSTPIKNSISEYSVCDVSAINRMSYISREKSFKSRSSTLSHKSSSGNIDSQCSDKNLSVHTEARSPGQKLLSLSRSACEENSFESFVRNEFKRSFENEISRSLFEDCFTTCVKICKDDTPNSVFESNERVDGVNAVVTDRKLVRKIDYNCTVNAHDDVQAYVDCYEAEENHEESIIKNNVELRTDQYCKKIVESFELDPLGTPNDSNISMMETPSAEQIDLSSNFILNFGSEDVENITRKKENSENVLSHDQQYNFHELVDSLASSFRECRLSSAEESIDTSSNSETIVFLPREENSGEDVSKEPNAADDVQSFNSTNFSLLSHNNVVTRKPRSLSIQNEGTEISDGDNTGTYFFVSDCNETVHEIRFRTAGDSITYTEDDYSQVTVLEKSNEISMDQTVNVNCSDSNETMLPVKSPSLCSDDAMSKFTVVEQVTNICKNINGRENVLSGYINELANVSPIEHYWLNDRFKNVSTRRQKAHFHLLESPKNETEKCFDEGSVFESTRISDTNNLTNNKYRKFTILPVDVGRISESKSSECFQSRITDVNSSSFQSIHLREGKRWRRSFMVLKNFVDQKFVASQAEECKGRLWKQNITHLLNSQKEFTNFPVELADCSSLKTGCDESMPMAVASFEEKQNICGTLRFGNESDKSRRAKKTRFSISVHTAGNWDESENEDADASFLSFMEDVRESFIVDYGQNVLTSDFSVASNRSLPDSARDIILLYCQQTQPLPFESCYPDSILEKCKKIGEGVYGEVFMLKKRSKHTILKIIPVEGEQLVNDEKQKSFEEVLSELVIAIQLSNLKKRKDFYTECFAEVQGCRCVYGRYPQRLIALWKEYDVLKGSENDSPKIFGDDQLYIVLELSHGGEDVESFAFSNALQALSVFNQVSRALAVAEKAFSFEHRDLHWGNILVARTKKKETSFTVGNEKITEKLHGVKVTIIDYTLSRISVNNRILFNDMAKDPDLFTAEGDFQFEVYRLMRDAVMNMWDQFVPKTNVYWLYYLLDKLINGVHYHREGSRMHNVNFKKIKSLYTFILKFSSSYDFIKSSSIF